MSRVFSEELVNSVAKEMKVADLANATIGDVLLVASRLEELTGIPFIRMDQGSPGLPANKIGIEAEKKALDRGVGSQYPAAAGVAELKQAASRFVKALSILIFLRGLVCLLPVLWQLLSVLLSPVPNEFRERTRSCLSTQVSRYKNLSCVFWVLGGSCSTFMISVANRCVPSWKVSCQKEILPL